jgi:hypothetical protein
LSALELSPYHNPLDLLCRFAPTPLKTMVHLESSTVVVETNDLSLLPSISFSGAPSSQTCSWQLIRDVDNCSKPSEVSIIMAGSLIVYTMGPACIIGADRERKIILAFISAGVDAPFFETSILPCLCRLTDFVTRTQEKAGTVPNPEVVVGERCNA